MATKPKKVKLERVRKRVASGRWSGIVKPMSKSQTAGVRAPMLLLMQVNALQAWRRLKSIRNQSRLLTAIIVLFLVGYAGISFCLFYKGLNFVAAFPGLGTVLTERLLYLLFAFLFVMLLLSNLIISYTNLFRNREASFLLALPVPAQTIFRWKFFESALLASWAFVFLIAPLLAAFGMTRGVPWHFYPVTLLMIGLFIILPGVAGSWLAINVARYVDRRSFQVAALVLALGLIGLVTFWWNSEPISEEALDTRVVAVLDHLMQKTNFAQFPFLPSYWLSAGVLHWAEGIQAMALFFILVLLSHVLFFGFLAFTRLGALYYEAANQVSSRASVWGQWEWFRASRRRAKAFSYPLGFAEKFINLLGWIGGDTRALLVKDIRMFWRDTSQWGQSVLLLGLLGVYTIDLPHYRNQLNSPFWLHLVSYLNLFASSLSLATLTTRFVYPQFSLEGQRLWIVGMAPMGLARVVKAKYWLGGFASLAVTVPLVVISSCLLKLSWERVVFFGSVIAVMTFSLNGLAAGLGVLYPNLKESNPTKIVSGFGGTFCLVLSFLYILGTVLILGFGSAEMATQAPSQWLAAGSIAVFILLSLVIGWLPLRLGLRRLRNMEF
jgi:ABC-2 type transport system permease protein